MGVVHFDGVRVNLGAGQGGRHGVEHLSIAITGIGGQRIVGIFEVEDGKGTKEFKQTVAKKEWNCQPLLKMFLMKQLFECKMNANCFTIYSYSSI